MTIIELQNAALELEPSASMESSTSRSSFNLLDTIKRSSVKSPLKRMLPKGQDKDLTGFATFADVTLSHSSSELSEKVAKSFSLIKISSDPAKLDELNGERQDEHEIEFHYDNDEFESPWNQPFRAGDSMEMHEKNTHLQKQQVFIGAAERTFRVLDAATTDSTEEVTQTPSSVTSWGDGAAENSRGHSLLDSIGSHAEETQPDETDGEEDFDYDDYDEDDRSNFSDVHSPLNAVESFLDELADADGIQTIGGLILNLGSCNAELTNSEDDFSVECPAVGESQRQRGRSTSPRTVGPPDSVPAAASNISETIYGGLQMAADAILEIKADMSNTSTTPHNSNRSFFQSMFSCND